MYTQNDDTVNDYGPEYDALQTKRNKIGALKKQLGAVVPPNEAITRMTMQAAAVQDVQATKLSLQLEKERAKLEQHVKVLEDLLQQPDFQTDGLLGDKRNLIETTITRARQSYPDREALYEFSTAIKREGFQLFAEQKTLLADMKVAKQNFLKSSKQQGETQTA